MAHAHLAGYPEQEIRLWVLLRGNSFEAGIAADGLTETRMLELLDFPGYFELLRLELPETRRGIVEHLIREALIGHSVAGGFLSRTSARSSSLETFRLSLRFR